MAKRSLLILYEGDFEWIDYLRRKEVTSLTNPYYAPEGTIEAIEIDPARVDDIIKMLKEERG